MWSLLERTFRAMRLIAGAIFFVAIQLFFAYLMKLPNMNFMAIDNARIFATCIIASLTILNYGKKQIEYYTLAGYLLLFGVSNLYVFYPTQFTISSYNILRYIGYGVIVVIPLYICFEKSWQHQN